MQCRFLRGCGLPCGWVNNKKVSQFSLGFIFSQPAMSMKQKPLRYTDGGSRRFDRGATTRSTKGPRRSFLDADAAKRLKQGGANRTKATRTARAQAPDDEEMDLEAYRTKLYSGIGLTHSIAHQSFPLASPPKRNSPDKTAVVNHCGTSTTMAPSGAQNEELRKKTARLQALNRSKSALEAQYLQHEEAKIQLQVQQNL